jgi:hypothetical protein
VALFVKEAVDESRVEQMKDCVLHSADVCVHATYTHPSVDRMKRGYKDAYRNTCGVFSMYL